MDIVPLDVQARQLAAYRTVAEVKVVRDRAETLRAHAKRAGLSLEMQNHYGELKLHAERRCGELLAELAARGERAVAQDGGEPGNKPLLGDLGVTKMQSSRWQLEASVPAADFAAYVAETREAAGELTSAGLLRLAHGQARDAMRATRLVITPPMGQYRCVVVASGNDRG